MREHGVISNISIGAAYGEAAAFARREKRLLAPLVLALLVLPMVVSQLVQPNDPFAGGASQSWILIALAALVLQLLGQMVVSRLAMGWSGSLGEALQLALRRLPAALGALLLYFACLTLLLVPLITVLLLAGGGGPPSAGTTRFVNSLTLLALLLLVPRVMLVAPFAVAGTSGSWALVTRTWRASRGQFWRLLGFFFLFLIASLILALAVSAVVGTLATLAFGAAEPLSLSRLLMALAGGLVQGIAGTLYAAMIGRVAVQLLGAESKGI
jgi:hypothetical protein